MRKLMKFITIVLLDILLGLVSVRAQEETPPVEPPTLTPTEIPTSTETPVIIPTEIPSETPTELPTSTLTETATESPTLTETPAVIPTLTEISDTAEPAAPVVDDLQLQAATNPLEVINANADGPGSLASAILFANGQAGQDRITFNIPGNGPHTIAPPHGLPEISDSVILDGLSQPGANCAAWPPTLKIEIQGRLVFGSEADRSTIRGLVINTGGILLGWAGGAVIQCNFVGTDVTGTVARDNADGISMFTGGTLIGGIGPETRNLISGNGTRIFATEPAGSITIQGNYIGTDVTGEFALGGGGISLDTAGAIIGGTTPGAGNVISGNGCGICITFDEDVVGDFYVAIIQGNYIGTNPSGTKAVPNAGGLGIVASVLVGGTEPGARNLISGNAGVGISVSTPDNNDDHTFVRNSLVQGNYIGTDITGTQALGNGSGASIGDNVRLENNIISGNRGNGVAASNYRRSNNVGINLIGIAADGFTPLGNGGDGVTVSLTSSFAAANVGDNTIAYNGGSGIAITMYGTSSVFIADADVSQNRIFSNGKLGIDLNNDSVTLNDLGDTDDGANALQNFPVLTSAVAGMTSVSGTLNTLANAELGIAIFANSTCDPSGYGEGEVSIGTTRVRTDINGNVNFTVPTSMPLVAGQFITALVTSGYVFEVTDIGNSEFSACLPVTQANPLEVVNTNVDGPGSMTNAILFANIHPGQDTITFNISGDGPYTIAPPNGLPEISDSVILDGLSQPGANCVAWPPTLKIELRSSLHLSTNADVSTLRGLVINSGGVSVIGARDTVIQCNFIGTDVTGTLAPGDSNGIFIRAQDVLVGGIGQGTRNLISGNENNGITAEEGAADLTVQGNYIGTDVTGEFALGNNFGISLDTVSGVLIGGTTLGAGNLISGNTQEGIFATFDPDIVGDQYRGFILGNLIGTNASGTRAVPNGTGISSVFVPIIIGGTTPGARNLISGNHGAGLYILTDDVNRSVNIPDSRVWGNYIGTDITGMYGLGNGMGVYMRDNIDLSNNVISGNRGNGVNIQIFEQNNSVQNNIIGLAADGTTPLGNSGNGVTVFVNNSQTSSADIRDNIIAYNAGNGVNVYTDVEVWDWVDVTIDHNKIFSNEKLGIDLGNDGVTLNDRGDADKGPNGLQNFPVLTATLAGASSVSGTINTSPNTTLDIEVFANTACDLSGYGEGELLIGETTVTTNAIGDANFSAPLSKPLVAGQVVTSRVSSLSEFSACSTVMQAALPAPVLLSPSDSERLTAARPSFSWRAVSGANRYRLQVSTNNNFSTLVLNAESDFTAAAPGVLPQGNYYWRVQARNRQGVWGPFSAFRRFELSILQSPANATDTASTQPTFQWLAYTGAHRYQLQVDDNIDFASPNFTCERTSSQPLSCTPNQPLPYGDYVWRVNIDSGQGFTMSAVSWGLSVRLKNLVPPGLIAPANGAITSAQPTFSWNVVVGAFFYQIQIDNDRNYTSLQDAGSGNFLSYTSVASLPPGIYYWHVRAMNSALQPGGWSATRSFRVG